MSNISALCPLQPGVPFLLSWTTKETTETYLALKLTPLGWRSRRSTEIWPKSDTQIGFNRSLNDYRSHLVSFLSVGSSAWWGGLSCSSFLEGLWFTTQGDPGAHSIWL